MCRNLLSRLRNSSLDGLACIRVTILLALITFPIVASVTLLDRYDTSKLISGLEIQASQLSLPMNVLSSEQMSLFTGAVLPGFPEMLTFLIELAKLVCDREME